MMNFIIGLLALLLILRSHPPKKESEIAAQEKQFGELGPPLVWLRPLQTGYGWQTAGYLPRLLQFRGSWQGQAAPGNAVGISKGQD
jgi:hypothetical protein